MPDWNTVSYNLLKIRWKLNWTQQFVAAISGLSIRTLSRAENGCSVSESTINKLARVYRINPASIYLQSENSNTQVSSVSLLDECTLFTLLQRTGLLSELQREVILKFTASVVGSKSSPTASEIKKILKAAVVSKESYNQSDLVNVVLETRRATLSEIMQKAL